MEADDLLCSCNADRLVCLVYLVSLVLLVSFQSDQPNKPDRPSPRLARPASLARLASPLFDMRSGGHLARPQVRRCSGGGRSMFAVETTPVASLNAGEELS